MRPGGDYTRAVLNGKQITVVLPAYNAGETLKRTVDELDRDVIDDVLLVDDASTDDTIQQAKSLGLISIRHDENRGYGGNQKSCYKAALDRGADIIVMVHPDYQYSPLLVPALAAMIAYGEYDFVLGFADPCPGLDGPRHAGLQVRRQQVPHLVREPAVAPEALRVPHGPSRLQQRACSRLSPSSATLTTSSSTTR